MNFYVDQNKQVIVFENNEKIPLYSPEGFKIISDLYVTVGWDQKQIYSYAWMGRPIIQLPDDMVRMQEVIYQIKPDVIIETGIAHGGSLIFYASLCKAMGKGKIVGVDIEIRKHNRTAIENHELSSMITLIEGSSTDESILNRVKEHIPYGAKTLIILDSCHDYSHVLNELKCYSPLVSKGSYIVATDGSQAYLNKTPRAQRQYPNCGSWGENNPQRAALDFVKLNDDFIIEEPKFPFNEGSIDYRITHWPSAYIKRIK